MVPMLSLLSVNGIWNSMSHQKTRLFDYMCFALFLFFFVVKIHWSFAQTTHDFKFVIKYSLKTLTYTSSELLGRKDKVSLELDCPVYPGGKTSFQAVPLSALFKVMPMADDSILKFQSLDGFSGPISSKKVMSQSPYQARAYLAVEPSDHKWPALPTSRNHETAGPFFLVWVNPAASNISREEWVYQLKGFEVKRPLQVSYPAIFPDANLSASHPVRRGLNVFIKNCFTCHTLNFQGESVIGPDLNRPMSVTEYINLNVLKKLIRNPQDVRSWPWTKMKGFSKSDISDQELDDLFTYLKYMAEQKLNEF